jgi:hypothetical protein
MEIGGTAFVILALLSLAGLGIGHKVADFQRCKPSAINVMLFFWAAAVLWSYTLLKTVGSGVSLFPPFTAAAVAWAVGCGLCASIAILTFQIGVRYGRISTSWLVINLSTIIPAVLSLVVYQEWKMQIHWQQPAALLLVLASVLLLWKDKAIELARGEEPVPQRPLTAAELAAAARQMAEAPAGVAALRKDE